MRFLDANIFIRYIANDDVAKAEACRTLFLRLAVGEEEATTEEFVIAEVVFVLGSRTLYQLSPAQISLRLQPLLLVSGLRFPGKRFSLRALDLYATYHFLGFADALVIAHVELDRIEQLYSYDRDFDRIPGVIRIEP